MAEKENVQLVKEAYAAYDRGDLAGFIGLLDEDIEWVTPGPRDIIPSAGPRHGRRGVEEFFEDLAKSEENELFEPREFIAQGDAVVVLIQYRGRVKATGLTAEADIVQVFRIRNSKIAVFHEYFDTTPALRAYRPGMFGDNK